MKRILYTLLLSFSGFLAAEPPPPLTTSHRTTPIEALLISTPIQEYVWLEGKVISQEDNDLYIIQDATGKIRIFLCLDELLHFTLSPGDTIAVWGKVDKSPISAEKNEFYVEKMYLVPATPAQKP